MCVFFNDTATTEIYTYGHTLSLHDALPIFDHEIGERVLAVLAHATEVEPSVLRRDAARAAHELTGGTLGLNACHGCAGRNAEPISPLLVCLNHNLLEMSQEVGDVLVLCTLAVEMHVLHDARSEEHTSELQSLMRISYA